MTSSFMNYGAVFIGGALGSLLRELLQPSLPVVWPLTSTFIINVVACLFIGVLYGIRHRVHAHVMALAAVGFCGGLSTFSSFVADVFDLAAGGDVLGALLAPSLEIVVGIFAAAIGEYLARRSGALPRR